MFNLDLKESEKLEQWLKTLPEGAEGAIGGRITYLFTPTNLGVVIKVRDEISKQEIDLTNYEAW